MQAVMVVHSVVGLRAEFAGDSWRRAEDVLDDGEIHHLAFLSKKSVPGEGTLHLGSLKAKEGSPGPNGNGLPEPRTKARNQYTQTRESYARS